jgi:hypothetical protein
MNEYRDKLMGWQPGMRGFSRDDMILAIGLQCEKKPFSVVDVLAWLGPPDKASGDATGGHLVYFHAGPHKVEPSDETAYMFDVVNGRVVAFGTIARYRDNAIREDGHTHFNILDDMGPFDARAFG